MPAEVRGLAGTPGPHELAVANVALEPGTVQFLVVVSPCYHPVPLYGTEFHYVEQHGERPAGTWSQEVRNGGTDARGAERLAEPKTLAEKVWERHVVHRAAGEPDLLYVDLHLVHEVTSPQAFEALRLAGRPVRRPDLTVATMDHNVPTTEGPVTDRTSARQMEALATNAKEFDITLYPWGSAGQGSCT